MLPSERLVRLAELTAARLTESADDGGSAGPQVPEQALAEVLAAVDASTAVNTKKAYRSDWARFTAWTTERGFAPLPAPPLVVAHYVTEAAAEQTGVGKWRYTPATLTRWVSSINQFHTAAGLDAPGRAEVVRRALSGVRRIRAIPPVRRSPLLLADIRTLMTPIAASAGDWPAGVAARRDMALLLMGFAGAHRRSELVALTLADVTLHRTDGLHVRFRSSKTDQEAHGQVKALPYGRDPVTCPPCAYVRWREVLHAWDTAADGAGRRAVMPVLRRQAASDTGGGGGEPDEEVGQHCCRTTRAARTGGSRTGVVPDRAQDRRHRPSGDDRARGERDDPAPRRAGRVHPRPDRAAGRAFSLRAGFVTEAFRAGADAHAIMRQTGHRSPAMLEVYAREHAPLMGNAVTRIGL